MRAMSTRNDEPERASRPFDKGRDGFVLGEGAGIVVLERAEHAAGPRRARSTPAGRGRHHLRRLRHRPARPGGCRARPGDAARRWPTPASTADRHRARQRARHLDPGRRHGRDPGRSRRAIGDHPVLTATKSMTGHLLGAAGAVESIATILAMRDGVVPPTINLDDPDDDAELDVVTEPRKLARTPASQAALNNSFGFGGHNVALVFTRLGLLPPVSASARARYAGDVP